MTRKALYLFLALLLPALIFLFLKEFGKNQFDIPVFYHSADSLNTICQTHYPSPYTVPDSVLRKAGSRHKAATVILMENALTEKELARLPDTFDAGDFQELRVSPTNGLTPDEYKRWKSCVFFASPPWDIVLVDSTRRIRGYYASTSREDVDRLIVEMKILLKQY